DAGDGGLGHLLEVVARQTAAQRQHPLVVLAGDVLQSEVRVASQAALGAFGDALGRGRSGNGARRRRQAGSVLVPHGFLLRGWTGLRLSYRHCRGPTSVLGRLNWLLSP